MRLHYQMLLTAAIAASLAGGWFWLEGREDPANSAGKPGRQLSETLVLVEPVRLMEDRIVVQAIGTSEAPRSASIYPTVEGEVVEVLFAGGQKVAAGDTLLHLKDKHERLAVRLAEVATEEAKRQVERLEKLVTKGAAPVARLETSQAEHESAVLRLAQARANLEDRTVTAPFDGVIGLTRVDKGDRVTEDTLIAILDDRSSIQIEFELPEDYADRITLGDRVSMRPWSSRDQVVLGTIAALDSRIDATTRALSVEATVANPGDRILPGMSFEVRLGFAGRHYPAVREVAVLWSRDGAYLWRVAEGSVEKVFVEVVRRSKGLILVDGPLEAGDSVVVEGVQGLRNDQKVDVAPFEGEADGQPGPAEETEAM
jgi:RND family efflux transporter MFP subunit